MINWNYIDAAQKLIERLFDEIKLLRKQIEQQDTIEKSIKNEKDEWKKISQSLKIKLDNITREKVRLSNRLNQYDTNRRIELQKLQKQYNGSLNIYRNQNNQLSQQVAELKRQKETLNQNLAEAEASQSRLLAKVAHQNQDARIHYDATSNRPQHHLLIDKYKTLKEQYFHSLAVSLFNFMEKSNPELNKQRKAKLNEIKAAISVTVLMGGHEIMKRKTDEVEELPPKLLEEMEGLLCETLQLNKVISSETKEILKKAVNSAQDKIAYPEPGKWEEEDFKNTSVRLSNSLFKLLELNISLINTELRDETTKVTEEALHFLERAALAEPPANFNLYEEDESFESDYHEAAKGFDDEGKIIKTIYPAYLVNGEVKVKAIVLTKS